MDLRYTYHDSETGEEDTIDFKADIAVFDETAGLVIAKAFAAAMAKITGEEEVDVKLEHFTVAGTVAALTFREKVVHLGGRHSYDILITGLVYSRFV